MHTESKKDRSKIMTKLNNMRVILTPSTLRTTLELPAHDSYDPLPAVKDMLKDIESLGYDSLLPQLSNFCGANLRHPWKSLFGLVNQCLSPKHAGFDKCNKQILQIFHGIAFNRKYARAALFFTELMDLVKAKENNKRDIVPYARWLSLIIHETMTTHHAIPQRNNEPHFAAPKFRYFKQDKDVEPGTRIPDYLLNLVNPKNPVVAQYKTDLERTIPMVQQNPPGPTRGLNRVHVRVQIEPQSHRNQWHVGPMKESLSTLPRELRRLRAHRRTLRNLPMNRSALTMRHPIVWPSKVMMRTMMMMTMMVLRLPTP
ncbi:unnamed protein product [Cuscuta europaea]|uniref:Uncharacterized protein n=1 Tax=Cuscuta europaea TaxID=41803 RepID=A0A9P0ZYN0_CUSEU|nr:unnamed protein product [Cuscuta europaea]